MPGFHTACYDHDKGSFQVKTKRLLSRITAQDLNCFVFGVIVSVVKFYENQTKAILKPWRNWPTSLAKHYCFRLKSGVKFLSLANALEINNSVCQANVSQLR